MNGRIFRMDIPAHQAVQELLPWYATSQLAPDETRQVHQHLQTCAQCRQDLEWEHGMRAEAAASATADILPLGVDMERALARLLPALGPQERAEPQGAAGAGSEASNNASLAPANGHVPAAGPLTDVNDVNDVNEARVAGVVNGDASATAGQLTRHDTETPAAGRWWRGSSAANQPNWMRWAVAAQWVLIVGLVALLVRPDDEPAAYRVLGSGTAAAGNLVVVFHPNTSERELRRILQSQNARVVDGPTVTDAYLISVPGASRDQALQALRGETAVKLAEPLDSGSAP